MMTHVHFGDAPVATAPAKPVSFREAVTSDTAKTASAIALTFHGYRRNNSIIWALIWGACGRFIPLAAVPIALAQGFGQKKACP